MNSSNKAQSFSFKSFMTKNLLAGLSVLVPLYLTIYIPEKIVVSFDQFIVYLPEPYRVQLVQFPGAGFLAVMVVTIAVGFGVRNFFGRLLLFWFNSLIERIPFVASLYRLLRQVAETVLGSDKQSFSRAVLVEWPRRECWTLGFVTSEKNGCLDLKLAATTQPKDPFISVFVPATPNITSGFYFMVREKETIKLDISVDQAFKTIISCGSIPPP